MPRENRNPPKQLTGPQGMTTLLTESNERFAHIEEKLDQLLNRVEGKLDELLDRIDGALASVATTEATKSTEEAEDKAKSKAKK